MPKISKYQEVYIVQGNYGSGWDDLTGSTNFKEARAELKIYNANEPSPHRLVTRRALRSDVEQGKF